MDLLLLFQVQIDGFSIVANYLFIIIYNGKVIVCYPANKGNISTCSCSLIYNCLSFMLL
jgi:hypothetical protein